MFPAFSAPKLRSSILVLGSLLGLLLGSAGQTYAEFRLSIRFEPEVATFADRDLGRGHWFSARLSEGEFASSILESELRRLGAREFSPLAPQWRFLDGPVTNDRGEEVTLVDFTDVYVVTFEGSRSAALSDPEETALWISSLPGVIHARPMRIYQTGGFPNDPLYPMQWNANNTGQTYDGEDCIEDVDINLPEAWAIAQGSGTKIAFLDTGVEREHTDLVTNVDYEISASCGSQFGCVTGSSYVEDCPSPTDHGTPVAGAGLAQGDNLRGIVSPANTPRDPIRPIVAIKVQGGTCQEIDEAGAILGFCYLTQPGIYPTAKITSNSWYGARCFSDRFGVHEYSPDMRDCLRNTFMLDMSNFACAGNGPGGCIGVCAPNRCWVFPAAYDDYCFGVGGITCRLEDPPPAGPQATGFWVDVTAPSNFMTTTTGSGYRNFGGCSAATPIVASVASLMLEHAPELTNEDIYAVLQLASDELGDPEAYGAGLIRADRALELLSPPYKIFRETATNYEASLIDERQQWFKNLDGINQVAESWEEFHVRVHRLDVPIAFDGNGPVFDPIVAAWPRKRMTTGAKNVDSLDVRFWAPFAEIDGESVTPRSATLHSFTYEIFDPDGQEFLCWYPVPLGGGNICGVNPGLAGRFAYSFLADTTSTIEAGPSHGKPLAPRERASAQLGNDTVRVRASQPSEIEFELSAFSKVRVQVFDTQGRRVTTLFDGFHGSGKLLLSWNGTSDTGRTCASGVYFAVMNSEGRRTSRRLFVSR